jgi:nitrite reductase/ring-hydroxylating ferredoxin subunit
MNEDTQWVEVLDLAASPVESPTTVQVAGVDVVLFLANGKLFAIQRWCPHMEADLKDGRVIGETVKCARHGMIFSLKDGRGINCHPFRAKAYEIRVDDGKVKIRAREGVK